MSDKAPRIDAFRDWRNGTRKEVRKLFEGCAGRANAASAGIRGGMADGFSQLAVEFGIAESILYGHVC